MATKIHHIMSTEGHTPFLLSPPKVHHIIALSFPNKGLASLLRILPNDGHKVNHNSCLSIDATTEYSYSTLSSDF